MSLAVVAIGGNSLIHDENHQTVEDQYEALCETVIPLVDMIQLGYELVLTHGNGPQVGFILRRSEIAYETLHLHRVPLVSCGADTQGAIGYQLQQALDNEFRRRGIPKKAVTVVTQVIVDGNDPAFVNPSKPIGSFYSREQVDMLARENPEWRMVSDAGRGYRRVVPSPFPREIVEQEIIRKLVQESYTVIGVGGGGIPVLRGEDGILRGVDAVIDKDFASSLLASELKADLFVILTAVPKVYINYQTTDERSLDRVTAAELRLYLGENHFAPGSMKPKIEAVIQYMERGGAKAIITDPNSLLKALAGHGGTQILPAGADPA